ncbi:MAG: porin, partial [Candidatus Sulfotelmatobacter sp.]
GHSCAYMSLREGKRMRSLTISFALVILLVQVSFAQSSSSENKSAAANSNAASQQEVDQLRDQLAAQQKTIDELKALVGKLADKKPADAKAQPNSNGAAAVRPVADTPAAIGNPEPVSAVSDGVRLRNAILMELDPAAAAAASAPSSPQNATQKDQPPLTAGWNGEHFFIRSPNGQFSISPYGYVDSDYRAYKGDGAPADTFLLRRGRFGFQGNYGSRFQFALLTDAAARAGSIIRDVYLNVRIRPEFQFQAGQFKVPFAQEAGTGATNLDFVERGFQAMLYPSAASAFRSPGIALHGDIDGGVLQYWAGIFNGKGYATVNTTNQPEAIGRLRIYPFRKSNNGWIREFAFGGAIDYGRARGESGDLSFNGTLPDGAYDFFPQFAINGPIQRYNGEFTYIKSAFALRGEFNQLNMSRNSVGSLQVGNIGFLSLPSIIAKSWNIQTTYLLTGEKRPENGTPRVKRPLFGPDTPGGKGRGFGAWEVALRYMGIQANEPGFNFLGYFTPGYVPTFDYHTDEITMGLNWYPNYWVRYMVNVSIDQLKEPSTIGAIPQNYFAVTQELQFRF